MTLKDPDTACGSYRGYMRHYRRDGKVTCFPCTVAMNLYHQDRRLAPKRRAVLAEAVGDGSYGGIPGGAS